MDYDDLVEKIKRGRWEMARLEERLEQLRTAEKKIMAGIEAYDETFECDLTSYLEPSPTNVILDAAEAILKDVKEPMSAGDILISLELENVRVGGAQPSSNLSAKLSQAKDRFLSHGRGKGWTLVESVDDLDDLDDDIPF